MNSSSAAAQPIRLYKPGDTGTIAVVTYATASIWSYAAYSLGINAVYAEQRRYPFYVFSPETGHEHEPRDQRWNRVKIISDALEPRTGLLRDVEWVVWMDADLIITDMRYSMEDIIHTHAHDDDTHIVISSERHAASGVANTGCFLIRNSQWSRDFLASWWANYDRTEAHDQIMFDRLYKASLPGVKNHVTILPEFALNSVPPPSLHQEADHRVLHLMGNADELRARIFRIGLSSLCSTGHENDDGGSGGGGKQLRKQAAQLTLDRQRLALETRKYLSSSLARAHLRIRAVLVAGKDEKAWLSPADPVLLDMLTHTRETLLQLQHYELSASEQQEVRMHYLSLFDLASTATRYLGYCSTTITGDSCSDGDGDGDGDGDVDGGSGGDGDGDERTGGEQNSKRTTKDGVAVLRRDHFERALARVPLAPRARDPAVAINWLNALAVLGNDVVHLLLTSGHVDSVAVVGAVGGGGGSVGEGSTGTPPLTAVSVLSEVGLALTALLRLVAPQSRAVLLEMKAGWLQTVAQVVVVQWGLRGEALTMLSEASAIFEQHPGTNPYHSVGVTEALAQHLCTDTSNAAHLQLGLGAWIRMIRLQEDLLFAEQHLKEDHLTLARTLIGACRCARHADEAQQAYQWARRADDILTRHPDGPAVAKLRNAHDGDLATALSAEPVELYTDASEDHTDEKKEKKKEERKKKKKKKKTATKKKFLKRKARTTASTAAVSEL